MTKPVAWGDPTGGRAGQPAPRPGLSHRPALDGLRAVAVTGVLYTHLWDPASQAGHLGVRLFFVLSGFLITGLLLDARSASFGPAWRSFLLRRALRILPAYSLLLGVLLALNVQGIREVAGWHLLHASNILFALRDDYLPWVTAHHWTLSVEEQFYLVWPFLILLAPAGRLRSLMIATIAAAVAFRAGAVLWDMPAVARWHLPFASFDALGAGALLALWTRGGRPPRALPAWGTLSALATAAMLGLPGLWAALGEFGQDVIYEAAALPALVALVAAAARPRPPRALAPLLWAPLRALGRISYGVYLYHLAMMALAWHLMTLWDLPFLDRGPAFFALVGLATVAVATLSWLLVERPLLRLKDRVPGPAPRAVPAAP